MKERNGKILVVVLTIMVVVLGGLNVYQYLDKKDDTTSDSGGMYLVLVNGHEVKVQDRKANLIEKNQDYALYNDNGLMLYNFYTRKSRKVNIGIENLDDVHFGFASNGFVYSDENGNNGFYNFETNSIIFKNKYKEIYPMQDNSGDVTDCLVARDKGKFYVLETTTGKTIITENDNWPCEDCYTKDARIEHAAQEGYIFATFSFSTGDTGGGYREYGYTIYDGNGKVLAKLADDEYYSFNNWNELTIYKEKK